MKIQIAGPEHFKDIISIYNWAILETTSTFDTESKTIENYSSFLNSFNDHPLVVAILNNKTVGWGCLKPYSDRRAYNDTVELSIYIHPNFQGQRVGNKIMQKLIEEAENRNFHTILSRITVESLASIKLHEKFGFFQVGIMKEVGLKFNRRIDVIIMQKIVKA